MGGWEGMWEGGRVCGRVGGYVGGWEGRTGWSVVVSRAVPPPGRLIGW